MSAQDVHSSFAKEDRKLYKIWENHTKIWYVLIGSHCCFMMLGIRDLTWGNYFASVSCYKVKVRPNIFLKSALWNWFGIDSFEWLSCPVHFTYSHGILCSWFLYCYHAPWSLNNLISNAPKSVLIETYICRIVGMAGIGESLLLVSFCGLCTFLTSISLSAIATNGAMKVYYSWYLTESWLVIVMRFISLFWSGFIVITVNLQQ